MHITVANLSKVARAMAVGLAFAIAFPVFGGPIVPSRTSLLEGSNSNLLAGVNSLPLGLSGDPGVRRPFIYLYTGAEYCDMVAVCVPESEVADFAEALSGAFAGSPLNASGFHYRAEDGLAVVTAHFSNGQLLRPKGVVSWNVSVICNDLATRGYHPQILFRLPLYGVVEAGNCRTCSTARSRYFLIDANPSGPLSFSASAPTGAFPIFLVLGLLPVVGTLTGFGVAVTIAKNPKIELDRRRVLFRKAIFGSTFGTMMIHAPLFMFLIIGGWARPVFDLWFGTRLSAPLIPVIAIGPLILVAVFATRNQG